MGIQGLGQIAELHVRVAQRPIPAGILERLEIPLQIAADFVEEGSALG